MTELKTLKDLGFHWSNYRCSKDCFLKKHKQKAYDEDELRQEAIKWVKTYRNLNPGTCHFDCAEEMNKILGKELIDGEYCHSFLDDLFIFFFNLTEEDLK